MPKLKDLMKSFLYENVEDDDTAETVEVEAEKETVQPVKTAPVRESAAPVNEPVQSQPVYKPVQPQAVVTETVTEEQVVETPSSSFLDGVSAMMEDAPAAQVVASRRTTRRKAAANPHRPAGHTEYQAVISPIFGNLANDKKEYDSVHDAINLPKPEENFEMVKVISPMYGNPAPKRSDPKQVKKDKTKKAAPDKEAPVSKPVPAKETKQVDVPVIAETTKPEVKKEVKKDANPNASLAGFLTRESVKAPAKDVTPTQETLEEAK